MEFAHQKLRIVPRAAHDSFVVDMGLWEIAFLEFESSKRRVSVEVPFENRSLEEFKAIAGSSFLAGGVFPVCVVRNVDHSACEGEIIRAIWEFYDLDEL